MVLIIPEIGTGKLCSGSELFLHCSWHCGWIHFWECDNSVFALVPNFLSLSLIFSPIGMDYLFLSFQVLLV